MKKDSFIYTLIVIFLLTLFNTQPLDAKKVKIVKTNKHKVAKLKKSRKKNKKKHKRKRKKIAKHKRVNEPYSLRSKHKDPELLGPASTLKNNPLARL